MYQKKVSILVLFYNHEKFVKDCLDSIYEQTYKDYEVLIRDDASTDNTRNEIENYYKNKSKHNVDFDFGDENLGIVKSYNILLSKAKGDYIFGLAGDDMYCPNRISRAMEIFNQYKCSLVANDAKIINENKEILSDSFYYKSKREYFKTIDLGDILNNNLIIFNNLNFRKAIGFLFGGFGIAYKKDILQDIGYALPDYLKNEDSFIPFIALLKGKIIFTKETLQKYRMHNNNFYFGKKIDNKIMVNSLNENYNAKIEYLKNYALENQYYNKKRRKMIKVIEKQIFINNLTLNENWTFLSRLKIIKKLLSNSYGGRLIFKYLWFCLTHKNTNK